MENQIELAYKKVELLKEEVRQYYLATHPECTDVKVDAELRWESDYHLHVNFKVNPIPKPPPTFFIKVSLTPP
jgi:hypothetical protein